MHSATHLRSALFVDFDNIFIGFERQQAEAAELFSKNPDRWVRWLEQQVPTNYGGIEQENLTRRILARLCYINPRSFHEYRPHFIRSGFEVVDCPPLTSQGKTSADIHMVIDMLDALAHPTRFDEFIVFSGDADFTPVLLRLRKHDRRTVILAVGPTSPAYKASSDYLLDESLFLENGLGIGGTTDERKIKGEISKSTEEILTEIAHRLEELVEMTGRVEAVQLPGVYKKFSAFTKSDNWLGFNSLRNMTEAVVTTSRRLTLFDEDPWWVGIRKKEHDDSFKREISGLPTTEEIGLVVKEAIADSSSPVVLASVAQKIRKRFGDKILSSDWLGAGSFKGLIERLDLDDLRVSPVIPGFVFDPSRHEPPESTMAEGARQMLKTPAIARTVSSITDLPYITSSHYATVLREIANEVNENGYHLTQTSKAVRDRCAGKGIPVARSHIEFILKGIVFAGHRFGEEPEVPLILGEVLFRNALDLCGRGQLNLNQGEMEETKRWILGELERGV